MFAQVYIFVVQTFDIPKNVDQCKKKLREEFTKYNDIQDVRLIDMLVIKVSISVEIDFLVQCFPIYIFTKVNQLCSTILFYILGPNGTERGS